MSDTSVRFVNERGVQLSGRIDLPDGAAPRGWVLFAHCFTCTRNLSAVRRIARGLTAEGLGVFSFDFTGLGASDGDFAETTFASQAADLLSAVEYLRSTYGEGPSIMVGHSLGGTATLYAARQVEGLLGVATIGAPADPAHVTRLFDCELEEIESTGEARVSIGGRPFSIRKEFVDDLRDHPPETWLGELRTRLLVFHSPMDTVVDISNAQVIYQTVRHPKSFVSLDRADHLLSKEADARHVARVLAAWADSFLPERESEATGESAADVASLQPETGFSVIATMGRTRYRVELSNGRHHVVADEPFDVRGGDLGGNPFDYLLWSLAACTVMTVRMYADRKEWPLETIRAQLGYEKQKDAFSIRIELAMTGDLDVAQRERLIEMAHRCPVHRTITGPVTIAVTERAD